MKHTETKQIKVKTTDGRYAFDATVTYNVFDTEYGRDSILDDRPSEVVSIITEFGDHIGDFMLSFFDSAQILSDTEFEIQDLPFWVDKEGCGVEP